MTPARFHGVILTAELGSKASMSHTTPTSAVVTRFAPSPSGHLHVGGARTALFCWAFAKGRGGKFVLRIEDTDQKRSSDAASIGFVRDLLWLGINFDEGPEYEGQGGGAHGPYFQAQRLDIYQKYLDQLLEQGSAYYAFESQEELAAMRAQAKEKNQPFRYTGDAARRRDPAQTAQRLKAGEPAVIRFHTRAGAITIHDEILGDATLPDGEVDDFVIRKADGFPTYHFAVVVDDELMGVTHVLRAQEHFNNSAKHIVLQDALGFRRPVYGHLPLIFNPDGSKMSKRDKDKVLRKVVAQGGITAPPLGTVDPVVFAAWLKDKNTQLEIEPAQRLAESLGAELPEINVDDFRRSGYLPEVICNFLSLNGWSPGGDVEKFDNAFLQANFDLSRVVKTAAKFDRLKLLAFNLHAIQGMSREEFVRRTRAHGALMHPEFMAKLTPEQFLALCDASHERSKTLEDLFRTNGFITIADDALEWDAKVVAKVLRGDSPCGLDHLRSLRVVLRDCDDWSSSSLEGVIKPFADTHCEGNVGKIAQPLRVAVCGGSVSPPIFDTLMILGKASSMRRIDRCISTHG
ncbi:MAG: glutamate--tRNA ligase [Phycisphaerales bacterium]|nr:glutamate--tRNA ligase [Phycisphaerales bacterium]